MSEDNVTLVRRLYEAWRDHGFGVVPDLMDPAIEYVNPPNAVEPGTRHGHEGFAEAAQAFSSIYHESVVTPVDIAEYGNRVVVRARVATRSKANAVPIEADRGFVFEVRGGLVTLFAWFNDPAEAVAFAQRAG